jgi:glycosyltransferase involved in cell wall biosynthesis
LNIDKSGLSRPRTIAWLIDGDEAYGVRQAIRQLTASVQENGWKTPLISLHEGSFARECRDRGYEVYALDVGLSPRLHGGMLAKPKELWTLERFQQRVIPLISGTLRDMGADAIHVLWPHMIQLAGASARRCGLPAFWEMPNIVGSRYFLGWNRWLYQVACWRNKITPLANSEATARTLGDWPVQAIVLYLGVDSSRFSLASVASVTREQLDIPNDAIVFGIIARLVPKKGQEWVLRSLLSLGEQGRSIHLLLLGGTEDDAYVRNLGLIAKRENASDRLHILGNVSSPERYYPLIDIAINGRIDLEPFGLSVIEAMMMERPVLVHAFGGPAETVIDGETGWHVNETTTVAMAAAMKRVLADRDNWATMGKFARQHAIENFSKECQAANYMKIVTDRLAESSH